MSTTPNASLTAWPILMSLPAGWHWSNPEMDSDARGAGRLVRRNMQGYWRARGMNFSLRVFLTEWPHQQSILWRPHRRVSGVLSWSSHGDHAHLCELQLDERHRRQGIGSMILCRWLTACHLKGIQTVELKVFRDNPAYGLYTRLGFWALAVDPDIPGFLTLRCTLDAKQRQRMQQFQSLIALSA